jgi:hypothetical protein
MGQLRKRRKRRRVFRKPDAVIVTLSSLAVILLLVWCGLYWKESSGRALIVPANGEEQVEHALIEDGGLQTTDSEGLNSGVNEQPSKTGETVAPAEQSNKNPGASGEVHQLPIAAKPAQDPVAKPQTQSPAKSESNSTPSNNSPSTAEASLPSPSIDQTNPPISPAEKYEQEIIQVQAMCTKDMNEVLSGAESSIQQLDRKDPFAVRAWMEKWTKELSDAESKCDSKFQEVSQNAENDSVSLQVIEEWKQTFSALKEKLQGESKAKMEQLMGG